MKKIKDEFWDFSIIGDNKILSNKKFSVNMRPFIY